LTKDNRDIFETIRIFKETGINLNIISMVGWTNVYIVIYALFRNLLKLCRESMWLLILD